EAAQQDVRPPTSSTAPLTTQVSHDADSSSPLAVAEVTPSDAVNPPDEGSRVLPDDDPDRTTPPACHYLVGASSVTPQWGVLGKLGTESIALDLNGCNTLSLFGVQGGGKSYTMGTILEMAVQHISGI